MTILGLRMPVQVVLLDHALEQAQCRHHLMGLARQAQPVQEGHTRQGSELERHGCDGLVREPLLDGREKITLDRRGDRLLTADERVLRLLAQPLRSAQRLWSRLAPLGRKHLATPSITKARVTIDDTNLGRVADQVAQPLTEQIHLLRHLATAVEQAVAVLELASLHDALEHTRATSPKNREDQLGPEDPGGHRVPVRRNGQPTNLWVLRVGPSLHGGHPVQVGTIT